MCEHDIRPRSAGEHRGARGDAVEIEARDKSRLVREDPGEEFSVERRVPREPRRRNGCGDADDLCRHGAGDAAVREQVEADRIDDRAGSEGTAFRTEIVPLPAGIVRLAVAEELAATVQKKRPLVVSIAAGIRIDDIERWLGGNLPIVRVMPNTAALIGSGATGLFANPRVTEAQRDTAESILRAVGVTVWVEDEALIDTVTAISGSGPAYFFLVMEVLEKAAIKHGLDPKTARLLTLETAYGAAKMALEGGEEPAQLRKRVTSPGGTTEKAVQTLEAGQIERIFDDAVVAAMRRARELADLFGK